MRGGVLFAIRNTLVPGSLVPPEYTEIFMGVVVFDSITRLIWLLD